MKQKGISCPGCDDVNSRVVDTRSASGGRWRRRLCLACHHRFSTIEIREGQVTPFSGKKSNRGVREQIQSVSSAGFVSILKQFIDFVEFHNPGIVAAQLTRSDYNPVVTKGQGNRINEIIEHHTSSH